MGRRLNELGHGDTLSAMSARHPRKSPRATWIVHRIGGSRGSLLGYVEVAAAEAFDISPADRRRIVVQRTSDQA
jgi:hypothetical protein